MVFQKTKAIMAVEVFLPAVIAFQMLDVAGCLHATLRCRHQNIQGGIKIFSDSRVSLVELVQIFANF